MSSIPEGPQPGEGTGKGKPPKPVARCGGAALDGWEKIRPSVICMDPCRWSAIRDAAGPIAWPATSIIV